MHERPHRARPGDGTATDPEDIIFQIRGSRRTCGTAPCELASWRAARVRQRQPPPAYFGVHRRLHNRWWTWQGAGAYGTDGISPAQHLPARRQPLRARARPGTSAATTGPPTPPSSVIENEPDWHGMLVSLGGDRQARPHVGARGRGRARAAPGSDEEMRHLPFVAKNADAQVGRIVDALDDEGFLDDTLIVITADHAAQTGRPFHGVARPGRRATPACTARRSTGIRSDCNWYYGQETARDEIYRDPSPGGRRAAGRARSRRAPTWPSPTRTARSRPG